MPDDRIGLWLIGAKGGVATTMMTGLAALRRGAIEPVGLVTALDPFTRLDLVDFADIVVGGHDIRAGGLGDEARRMWTESRAITPELLDGAADFFAEVEARLRPGTIVAAGDRIQSLADARTAAVVETPRQAIDRVRADIEHFQKAERLAHVVVVNVASTEPPPALPIPKDFAEVEPLLNDAAKCPLPASSLYFLAAAEAGASYVNFTPSTGATPACLQQVAIERKIAHAGCDGKTGETLLKSVLAPMFAARHLEVMSWVGHNIFGNMDGKVLDDPRNKAAKVRSKDHLLASILGYPPQTHVSIEYIQSLGDWKTAWDHIHFRGFLGTPMTLQFTWQGCDSILAAPLVLDLVRLVERGRRAGEYGALEWLACFFKSPVNVAEQDFSRQVTLLDAWATAHAAPGGGPPPSVP
ncbi:MAG: inositol-3-phosphate synthase [Planctomycetia bacterium]|jgi:myo-inositol-1-phosphate synthase|nr:inositol-3-phosphate synthase [Planctomycetia bacterium]